MRLIPMVMLLALPALLPLLFSVLSAWPQGLVPTGFIQYDMAYYMANAREHFDQGFRLTYGNPYAGADTAALYFQPHIFLLGLLQLVMPPAWAFNLFGVAAIGFTSTAAALFYGEVVGFGSRAKKLGFVCFFWGGGILSLIGLALGLATGSDSWRALFALDPNDGWWMLNFGRNLVYPTEAYYHGVFLFAMLFLVRREFGRALLFTGLLSLSHPFTGLSLALIVVAYAALELLLKSGAASWRLLAGAVGITVYHVGYYLVFLNRSPDHRALRAQWEIDWPYVAWTWGPALYLVGFLAFTRFTREARSIVSEPRSRLLLVWFAVVFGLTQHDLVMKPMQPIHFAHGYDWMALFFLAAPALVPLLEKLSRPTLAFCLLLMVSDNVAFFASFWSPAVQRYALALSPSESSVLDWLGRNATARDMVASDDENINYLTSTYSAARSWHGHNHNTPHAAERKRELALMQFPAPGPNLFVLRTAPPAGFQKVKTLGEFSVYRRTL